MEHEITHEESRFIRRDIINAYMHFFAVRYLKVNVNFLIALVRDYERDMFGNELNTYLKF